MASARSPVSAAGTVKEATRESAVATSGEVTPIASCAAVREPASTPDSELTVEGNSGGSTAESSREEANEAKSAARHTGANREAVKASVLSVTVTDVQSAAAVREAELCAEVDDVMSLWSFILWLLLPAPLLLLLSGMLLRPLPLIDVLA